MGRNSNGVAPHGYTEISMSRSRRDSHQVKLRRDRIRREKHAPTAGPPSERSVFGGLAHPFAAERTMRELQAWTEGRKFESIEEANAALAEVNESGRLSEIAQAWKSDDPKWHAQELAYDALEADSLEEVVRLTSEAIKLDPECTDAQRLQVSVVPMSAENPSPPDAGSGGEGRAEPGPRLYCGAHGALLGHYIHAALHACPTTLG